MIIQNDKGEDVEVFTAEEVTARETATRTAVENEWKPKVQEQVDLRTAAEKARDEKATQLSQQRTSFQKLSEEQQAKLTDTERTLYKNQELLLEERERTSAADKKAYDNTVIAAIRAKVGNDQKLFDKVKDMYELINIVDDTAEAIASRVNAAVGALGNTEPDLFAAAGFQGGSFEPPKIVQKESTEPSEIVKQGAAELGLIIEAPKK